MRRAVERADEYRSEIVRLREQVTRQAAWLDSPDSPDDAQWDQRFEIHCDRWQSLEQTIGNLTGWVAIHLAEAGRMSAEERKAAHTWVEQLYGVERWMEQEDIASVRQYVNDDEIPF